MRCRVIIGTFTDPASGYGGQNHRAWAQAAPPGKAGFPRILTRGYESNTVLANESETVSVGVVASGSAVRVVVALPATVIGVRAVLAVAGHGLGPDQGADARPDRSGLACAAEG